MAMALKDNMKFYILFLTSYFFLSQFALCQKIVRSDIIFFQTGSFLSDSEFKDVDTIMVLYRGNIEIDTFKVVRKMLDNNISQISIYETNILEERYQVQNNLKEGIHRSFYPSGLLKSHSFYHKGNETHPRIEFYESGALKSISSIDYTLPNGSRYDYYDSGELRQEYIHVDTSKYVVLLTYYKSGKLRQKVYGTPGDETFLRYYEDGQIQLSGKIDFWQFSPKGEWLEFYENGKIKSIKKYHYYEDFYSSYPEGVWVFYDEKGQKKEIGAPDKTEPVKFYFIFQP